MQQLINTYYHGVGSDGATVDTSTASATPIQNTQDTVTQNVTTNTQVQQVQQQVSTQNTVQQVQQSTTSSTTQTAAATQQTTSSSSGTYAAYSGRDSSIVEALKSVGETNTSYRHRAQIAAANGITGYRGRAEQNEQLLSLLKKGQLKKA